MNNIEKTMRGRVRLDRGFARRLLSLLLALNLLLSGFPTALMEDEIYSENVDPVVEEVGEAQYGAEETPEALPTYDMLDADSVALSEVLSALELPIGVADVQSVALLGNADDPVELGDPIGVVPVDGDYTLQALRAFTDARVALYTYAGGLYTIRLIHEALVAPAAEEQPEQTYVPETSGDGQAQEDYAYDLGGAQSARVSEIAAGLGLSVSDIESVGLVGSEDGGTLLSIENTGDDYVLTVEAPFDEARIVLYTLSNSFPVRLLNGVPGEQAQTDDDDNVPADAPEDVPGEAFELPAPEDQTPEAEPVEQPQGEIVPQVTVDGDMIVIGPDAVPEGMAAGDSLSTYETQYLRLSLVGGSGAAVALRRADPQAPAQAEVLEAFEIAYAEHCEGLRAELVQAPALLEGEYLALHVLRDGAVAETVDDVFPADCEGLALVRHSGVAYQHLSPMRVLDAVVEVSGTLPVGAHVQVTSFETGADVLASFEIVVRDARGNDVALADFPVEVTVHSDAIREARAAGSELTVRQYENGADPVPVETRYAEDGAVTFEAAAAATYTVEAVAPATQRYSYALTVGKTVLLSDILAELGIDGAVKTVREHGALDAAPADGDWRITLNAADAAGLELALADDSAVEIDISFRLPLTITANDGAKVYDGTALTEAGYTSAGLAEGDSIERVAMTGSQTAVGTGDNVPGAARIVDASGEDVTAKYDITYVNGALVVTQRPVTITTGSESKAYDGTALTDSEAGIVGLAEGETATVTATGTITEVGEVENTYAIDWGETDRDNYAITEDLGTLTITESGAAVVLTAASDGGRCAVTVTCDPGAEIVEGDQLNVSELSDEAGEAYIRQAKESLGADYVNLAMALDMSIVRDGAVVQPGSPARVSVELTDAPEDMDAVRVFRFGDAPEALECALEGRTVEFETSAISTLVLLGYGPDFQWGDYTYNMKGAGEVRLSALLESLGVTEIGLTDVTGVGVSDPEIIDIEQTEGDWLLRPLAPFNAGEALTLALANGRSVEIRVENPYPAQSFASRVSGVSISVEAPEGAFPEGVTMKAKRVWNNDTLSDIREAMTEDFVRVHRVQAVDIAFFDVSGAEIEPRLPISVVMSVSGMDPEQNATVVHVDDAGEMDIQDAEVSDPLSGTMAVSFDSEQFSLYAIVVTEAISTHYIDASGKTWNVEVSYGPEAGIPSGAVLAVSELTGDAADEYAARAAEALNKTSGQVSYAKALDIAILVDGVEKTPTSPVFVSIKLLDAPEVNENTNVNVLHFGNGVEPVSCALNGENVEFETDGFSVYVVTYTVDFHWGDYTYSIAGESEIALSRLFEKLGVTEITMADVAAVSFTDPAYIEIEQLGSDWLLRSLAPFKTEEALLLTLTNGETVEIKVTDAVTLPASGTWDNGSNGSGTWAVDENGVLTITGNGGITNYDKPTYPNYVKDTPWFDYINDVASNGEDSVVTKIVISDGITRIGTNTFTRTYNLNEIDASNCATLQTIGSSAFKQQSGSTPNNQQNPKKINFSGCTNLSTIEGQAFQDCKGIEEIDISGTKLNASHITTAGAGFGASKTSIKTLKANNCTNLSGTLNLSGYSALTTLELSGCTNLTDLNLTNCTKLTSLNITGCTNLSSINLSSCVGLTVLDISGYTKLTTLTLNNTTGLTTLDVSDTGITALDVSKCTSLTSLDVSNTDITSLDVSKCTRLTSLDVSGTGITGLDVSKCTRLTSLDVSGTGITSLDVSKCTSLASLDVSGTGLTSLKAPGSVTSLNVSNTTLTSLDVSGCNGLTDLDVPDSVTTLNVSGSGLTSLDVRNCAGMTELDASGCASLKELTVSDSVTKLNVSGSGLTSLDVRNCAGMTELDASGCASLTSLNVSDSVTKLDVSGSGLTELTVPGGVKTLDVSGSNLTSLNFSDGAELTKLDAANCAGLTSLDVSKCTKLTALNVSDNVTDLNIAGTALSPAIDSLKTSLKTLTISTTNPKNVDLRGFTALKTIYFDGTTEELETMGIVAASGVDIIPLGDVKNPLTITFDKSLEKTYDGNGTVTVDISDTDAYKVEGLEEGHAIAGLTLAIADPTLASAGANVGTYSDLTVSDITVVDGTGKNVTRRYEVTCAGTLEIKPAPVTVKARPAGKLRGDEDPKFEPDVTGLVGTDKIECTFSRAEGEVAGEYDITITSYTIYRPKGEDTGEEAITPKVDEVSNNYDVVCVPGTLTIRIPVSVTADTMPKTYGDKDGLTATVKVLDGNETATVYYDLQREEGENIGEYIITPYGAAEQGLYFVTYETGILTITPKEVTVKADDLSKIYGNADPILTATVTGLVGKDKVAYTLSRDAGEQVDGKYTITPIIKQETQGNYTVKGENGTFTIEKKPIIITAHSDSKPYDGTALTKESYTPTSLAKGDSIQSVTVTGSQTEVGSSENVPSEAKIVNANGDDVTANYDIKYQNGVLLVQGEQILSVLITADSPPSRPYDGDPLTAETWTSAGLAEGDVIESVMIAGTQTMVGTSATVPSGAKIVNSSGEDVTANYAISYVNGTLEVTQRPLTITAGSDSKIYDGTALTMVEKEAEGLVEGHTIDALTITGSQTLAGTVDNVPSDARIIDAQGEDVTDQYDITFVNGTLEVLQRKLTIVADDGEKFYDRKPLTKNSYTWIEDLALTDSIESVTIEGEQTEVGTSENTASGAKIVNNAGEDVTASYDISYEKGTLEVKKKNVLVTADNQPKTYGDADPKLTVSISGLLSGDAESLIHYTIFREKGENVGNYPIRLVAAETQPAGEETPDYYNVIYRDGTLTISPAPVKVKADDVEKVAGTKDPLTATVTVLKNGDDQYAWEKTERAGDKIVYTDYTLKDNDGNSLLTYTLSRPDNNEENLDREKSGEHEIVVTGAEEQGNYTLDLENGTLTIKKLTITFKNGEDTVRTCELELNQAIGGEDDLSGVEKTGCDFKAWYTEDGTKVTPETPFGAVADLYAHFTVTVSFEADEVDNPTDVVRDEGAAIGKLPTVSKDGYRFDGWYREPDFSGAKVTAESIFNVHTTLYAKFVKQVKVRFEVAKIDADGTTTSSIDGTVDIDQGAALGAEDYPALTVPDGYALSGWYIGDTRIDAEGVSHPIDADTTVTAHVVKQTTVTYKTEKYDGSVGVHKTDTGDMDRSVRFPDPPVLKGATFKGWFDAEGHQVSDGFKAVSDMELTAHYTVTVSFYVNKTEYSTPVVIDKDAEIGDKLLNAPVQPGSKFEGWFVMDSAGNPGETEITANSVFSAHTNVVAKFSRQVTITFLKGDTRQSFIVTSGTHVDLLETPIEPDSRFDGWYEGDTRRTNALGLTDAEGNLVQDDWVTPLPEGAEAVRYIVADRDMELTARFIKLITVNFLVVNPDKTSDSANTPAIDTQKVVTIDSGMAIPADMHPINPEISTYGFQGWYTIRQYTDADGAAVERYSDIPEASRDGVFVLDKNMNGIPYVLDSEVDLNTATFTYPSDPDDPVEVAIASNIVAKLAKMVSVTYVYEVNNQHTQKRVDVLVGDKVLNYVPEEARKDGFRLEWDKKRENGGEAPVTADTLIERDDDNAIIIARYIEAVTLTFRVEGQEDRTIVIDKGTKVSDYADLSWPDDPGAVSGRFIGWYNGNTRYTADTAVNESVDLTPKFGYKVTFNAHIEGQDKFIEDRDVEGNGVLGWVPDAPFWVNHTFREWRIRNTDGTETPVTAENLDSYPIDRDTTVTAYYDDVSIYTIMVNYYVVKGEEANYPWKLPGYTGLLKDYVSDGSVILTDYKYLTENRNAYTATNPLIIDSPNSFKQNDGEYFPVMPRIRLVPDANSVFAISTEDEELPGGVSLTYDSSNGTITIEMPFIKANAKYSVRHMLLKLDGDAENYADYQEIPNTADTDLMGLSGVRIIPPVKDAVLEYATLKKADLIEVVDGGEYYVYYTRKEYLLTYDSTGGSSVKPTPALYGRTITLPSGKEVPTRTGYTFAGWFRTEEAAKNLTQNQKITSVTISGDTTVFAGWKAEKVNYTVVYMFEKYNDSGTNYDYVYDGSDTMQAETGTTVKATDSGIQDKTKSGWEKDAAKNKESSVVIAADGSSVLKVYYKLKEYTFRFNAGTYTYNNNKEYYVEATLTGKNVKGTGNLSYTMTVKLGQDISGSWPGNVTGRYDRSGWKNVSFNGWLNPQSNTRYVTKRTIVTSDMLPNNGNSITYKARWATDATTYTVNYWLQNADDDNYTKSEEYSQTYTSSSGNLGAKEIAGYTYDHGNSGAQGVTTYNFYYNRNAFKIDYYYGSTKLDTIENVKFDANINKTPYVWTPTAAQCGVDSDYTFDDWYGDSGLTTKYTFTTMPANDVMLYAKWTAPEYPVYFHLNYTGAILEPYIEVPVLKEKTVLPFMTEEQKAKYDSVSTYAPDKSRFKGWYLSATENEPFDPQMKIMEDTHVYAQWEPLKIGQYKVQFRDKDGNVLVDDQGNRLIEDEIRHSSWEVGDIVTEDAPYIAGYSDSDTLIADEATKSLTLSANEEDNVITFYYDKRPVYIKYRVRYLVLGSDPEICVLGSDPDGDGEDFEVLPNGEIVKKVTVSGGHKSVTEWALEPTKEGYTDYHPVDVTLTKGLGRDEEKNVITFYYTKGAKITVRYLDMAGEAIPGKSEQTIVFQEAGKTWPLDAELYGYTLHHVKKDGEPTEERSFTPTDNAQSINIDVYYQYKLSIVAKSWSKPYNGYVLTGVKEDEEKRDDGIYVNTTTDTSRIIANGLKSGHSIAQITLTGGQLYANTSDNVPSAVVITGLPEGVSAEDVKDEHGNIVTPGFYDITYTNGTLSVTKINVIISLEPDRWTGNVYDGTEKPTGFTNAVKGIGDYIKINNDAFRNQYLSAIWDGLIAQLKVDLGEGNYKVTGKIKDAEGNPIDGFAVIIGKSNVGDSYKEAGIFENTLLKVLGTLDYDKDSFNLIWYVRESMLEIQPRQVKIVTQGDEKEYDGKELTNPNLTVFVYRERKIADDKSVWEWEELEPDENKYELVDGEVVTIVASGSQTIPGTSRNTYTIKWPNGEEMRDNYAIQEELGVLNVKACPIIIEAQDIYKAFGEDDPAFAVKVYPAEQDVDDNGDPLVDGDGNPVYKKAGEEISAKLTRWEGDNYTLQLDGTDRKYKDNLSIRITRVAGETPGTYVITPDWADGAEKNYDIEFIEGKLAICIARVSNDNGANWSYHQWLENDSAFYPNSAYAAGTSHPSEQGAFDRAREIGGKVIVETLCSNDAFEKKEIPDRYVLGRQVELTVDTLTSLTLRTTTGASFTSVIRRGFDGNSLFRNKCKFTLENITLDGNNKSGRLAYVQQGGTLNVRNGATLQNAAEAGKGGAVYVEGALNIGAGASITGNTASGGNAVFVTDGGAMSMTGGSITGNNNTSGSAVEIDGAGASLTFSGDAVVYDNTNTASVAQRNVCLSYDSANVINAAELTSKAKIGVYVPNTAADAGAEAGKLFAERGSVLGCFGTYTDSANLEAFVNDRNSLKGTARDENEIIWVQPITVEVRYMANLNDYATMPTEAASAYMMYPSNYRVVADIEYIPSMGKSKQSYDPSVGITIEDIEKDIYDNFGGSAWSAPATKTMVFWRGYAGNEKAFGAYLEALKTWPGDESADAGLWSFDKNSDPDVAVPVDKDKLVLYYTEPAYITIRNNCGHAMKNDQSEMKILLAGYTGGNSEAYDEPGDEPGDVNVVLSAFEHAYVRSSEEEPYRLVTPEDLSLADDASVTLMIPGAVGALYWIKGEFQQVIENVTVISVNRTSEKEIKLVTGDERDYPSAAKSPIPMSRGNAEKHYLYGKLTQTTELRFNESYVCKITDKDGYLLQVNGEIQAFDTLEEGFKAYAENALDAYVREADGVAAKPAYIKMLVDDYDLKLSRLQSMGDYYKSLTQITAPAGKPVILTTAATTDDELPGPYEAGKAATRCVIRRGICSTSMFYVPDNASLTTMNIIFDGGAVFEDGVYSSGEIAENGGIVKVDKGTLAINEGTLMRNSAVTSSDAKAKMGGAIYAAANSTMSITGTATNRVEFTNCQANGGGAIYNPGKSGFAGTVKMEYCTFNYCQAKGTTDTDAAGYCGGGAVRSMVNSLTLDHCEFNNCSTVQQGGAVYHLKDGVDGTVFKAEHCKFTSCRVSDPNGKVQAASGGAESQARSVTVDHCTFTDCSSSKNAGAFNVFNTNATINVNDTTFVRCQANGKGTGDFGNGGALRTTGSRTTVDSCTFRDCVANNRGGAIHCKTNTTITGSTIIQNSKANVYGGGAVYLEKGTLTIEAVTIRNCEAPDGGAIYQGGGTCYFKGGRITDCVSKKRGDSNGRGGGVYMGGGTCNMNGGTITRCNAHSNGGGVCLNANNATFNLNSGAITYSNSLASGGGVYMGSGNFTFADGQISRCSAKTGGGIYISGMGTVSITKNGEAITKCKAAQVTESDGKFTVADTYGSSDKGGGLYQNGGTLTIKGATISDCSAYYGGGIYLGGDNNTALNFGENGMNNGGRVKGCTAHQDGGGIYQNAGTLNLYSGTSIEENREAQNGGGIFLNAGTLNMYSGATIQKNGAENGGGIYQGGGTQIIHDGSIKSNTAKENGGGIYLDGGSFTLEGGDVGGLDRNDKPVGGNTARRGGGLYVGNGKSTPTEASIKGGLLGGNHATEVAGGGGIAIGGPNVRLYFEGSIQVWGNTMEPNPDYPNQTTCDVCLNEDSNDIIHTTKVGLNEDSHIGVYVPDKAIKSKGDLFADLHGTSGLPFGTFDSSGDGDNNLERFINNRSGSAYHGYEYYYGVRKPEDLDSTHRIYWVDYVCEITDPDGKLLFTNSKATAPALYQYLDRHGAFETLRNHAQFYTGNGDKYTGTEYHVQMLVLNYDLKWTDSVVVPANGKIKLMMAHKEDGNLPSKVRKEYDKKDGVTTINRGACTGTMFTTSPNSDFTLECVELDGGAKINKKTWSGGVDANGALIQAKGDLTLNDKVLLHHSYNTRRSGSGGGGAIAYTGAGKLTINKGAVIDHCKATDGGVLYVNVNDATVVIEMDTGAMWQNCEADSGLIYVEKGVVNLNSAFDNKVDDTDTGNVSGCTVSAGGLAYVHTNGTLNVNSAVKELKANNGGAIYVDAGTVNLKKNASIEGCTATTNGGGLYMNGGTLNMAATEALATDPSIKNCKAVLGGGIYETGAAASVNISGGEISGNRASGMGGGALRLEENAQAAISGTAKIKDNKVIRTDNGDGWGGAVNIRKGHLTISGGTISGNGVETTNGKGHGGAISVGNNSILDMTGGVISGNYVTAEGRNAYASGGAISMDGSPYSGSDIRISTVNISGGTIEANEVTADGGKAFGGGISVLYKGLLTVTDGKIIGNKAANGGAVYVDDDGTMTLRDATGAGAGAAHGTIYGNTATNSGAGIYLAEGSTLNLSGAPDFGGTGRDGDGADADIITERTEGSVTVPLGNFVEGTLSGKTNGQKNYAKYRQDIYVAGYLGTVGTDPKPATAIVLNGDITSGAGSIWVAAEKPARENENNHYYMLKQFAVAKADVTVNEVTMQAFRNAWDDGTTGCGADYLTGQEGDALSGWTCIYWTGGFDFLFKKIDSNGDALNGATFTLYKAVEDPANSGQYVPVKNGSDWVAYEQTDKKNGGKKPATATSGDGTQTEPQAGKDADHAVTIAVNKGTADAPVVDKVDVYGNGLAVFEKIPPGVYFIKENLTDADKGTVTIDGKGYKPAEPMYMIDLNGKGYYDIYVKNVEKSADEPVWKKDNDKAPTSIFVRDLVGASGKNDRYTTPTKAVTSGDKVLPVYTVMNESALSRKVILRKVDKADYTALEGARFRVFRADMTEIVNSDYDETNHGYPTLSSGVYFIDTLPEGKYYVLETQAPGADYEGNLGKVFTLTVKDGMVNTLESDQKIDVSKAAEVSDNLKTWVASQSGSPSGE